MTKFIASFIILDMSKTLSIIEASEYLKLTRAAVYNMVKSGKLTPLENGNHCRLDAAAVEAVRQQMAQSHREALEGLGFHVAMVDRRN